MKITGVSKRPGEWVMLKWKDTWFELKANSGRVRLQQVGRNRLLPNPFQFITVIHPTYKTHDFLTASEGTQNGTLRRDLKLGRKQLNPSATVFNYDTLVVYEITYSC